MAANYSDVSFGTPITWTNTGGDKAMNMLSLANAGIRQGVKSDSLIDGTKGFPEALEITVEYKLGSAPADNLEAALYLGFSSSSTAGTDNPGGLSGTDAAVSDADVLPLLDFVGVIPTASSLGTGTHKKVFIVRPRKEYVCPVFQNSTGQTTSGTNGETAITIRPMYRRTPIA